MQEASRPARMIAAVPFAGPPASQANAETAVATLKESRFKEELQKALEDCNAELEDHEAEPSDSRIIPVDTASEAPAQPANKAGAEAQAVEDLTRENSVKVNDSQATHALSSQLSPSASGGETRPCSPVPDPNSVTMWALLCVAVVSINLSAIFTLPFPD